MLNGKNMKFKVWDIKYKEWRTEELFYIDQNGILNIEDDEIKFAPPNLVIVYSTEKKDKNSVELFQGDIIKNDWRVFVVEWNKELASFKLKCLENGFTYDMNSFIDTLEKIGTIFENPELLEKK